MNKIAKLLMILIMPIFIVSCALGPDYKRPSVNTPLAWRYEPKEAQDVANIEFWKQFGDPVLDDLIIIALKENRDLKIAAVRVEEYAGRLMVVRADLFPQINASGAGGVNRISEANATPIPSSIQNPSQSYQGSFNGYWELDIWGRLRRADEAARADLLSSEEGRRGVILTLVSSVATGYVNLLELDNQLAIAISTVKSREKTMRLFQRRFQGGMVSKLEVSQTGSQYAQALSKIPVIEKQISQQENALSILLGKNPGPIKRSKTIADLNMPMIPQGLPSDLLDRRPDIRQAEQVLISANARIGVARALYFPTISLTGAFGSASASLSNLFTNPAMAWNWSGGISIPIFAGGAIVGQNKVAQALQKQALLNYQKTIQNAFRETNDALVSQTKVREQLIAEKEQIDALKVYYRVARARFESGYTSYIEALDAERSIFDAEIANAQSVGALFKDMVNIYKTMGGGWVAAADRLTFIDADHKIK